MIDMQMRRTIQLKTKRGYILNAFAKDSITKEAQKNGEYDSNTLNSLSEVLAKIKPHTSLDVGANIGNHALVIARYSENLIAFEPIKFIFEVLKTNLQQNQIVNATAVNIGLSDMQRMPEIFIPLNGNLGSSSLEVKSGEGERLQINVETGDDYLARYHPDAKVNFIKMDVEGHEVLAIQGLRETINKFQPLMLLEWKSVQVAQTFLNTRMFEEIFKGYRCYSLTYTGNKKVHPQGLYGIARRLYFKLFANDWCLSDFDPHKHYSNVYFVLARYQQVFAQFRFLSKSRHD